VPIRDFATILEALADGLRATQNLSDAVEICRLALSRVIVGRYAGQDSQLAVVTVHPDLERRCLEATVQTTQGIVCGLDTGTAMRFLTRLKELAEKAMGEGLQPVLLVSPNVRRVVRHFTERDFPTIPVISHAEVPPEFGIQILGQIAPAQAASAA
jgi:flagellar biosynthesis protein FlhA